VTRVATPSVLGIDVYAGNGDISWTGMANAGIQFAYIKATESTYSPDTKFQANTSDALNQHIAVGAYHFATPLFSPTFFQTGYDHQDTAVQEAANFVNTSQGMIGSGFLPPALDVEAQVVTWIQVNGVYIPSVWVDPLTGVSYDNAQNPLPSKPAMGAAALAQWIEDWVSTVSQLTHVTPIVYCDRTHATALAPYLSGTVKLWIADWSNTARNPDTAAFQGWSWIFHQYSSTGAIAGTSPIDLDVFNGDSTAFKALLNGTTADTQGPTLTITSPANNVTVTTSSLLVSGTATDSGKGNSGISSVTVNGVASSGGTASATATANWSATVSLNSGANSITVIATDGSGNSTKQQIAVVSTIPSISSTLSALTVTPTSVPSDGQSIITATATLRDSDNKPISGKTINFHSTSTISIVQPAASTDANGQATGTMTSTSPITATLWAEDVTDMLVIQQQPTLLFTSTLIQPNTTLEAAITQIAATASSDLTPYIANLALDEGQDGDYFQQQAKNGKAQQGVIALNFGFGGLLGLIQPDEILLPKSSLVNKALLNSGISLANDFNAYGIGKVVEDIAGASTGLSLEAQDIGNRNAVLQQALLEQENSLLAGIPSTSANLGAAFATDFQLRSQANQVLKLVLINQDNLLLGLKNTSELSHQNADYLTPLFATVNVAGAIFGTIATSEALNAGESLISADINNQNLTKDQQSYNTAVASLTACVFDSGLIYSNVASAFSGISQGRTPHPVTGQILQITSRLTGTQYNVNSAWVGSDPVTTPMVAANQVTGASSVVAIQNNSLGAATFTVYASYQHTSTLTDLGVNVGSLTLPFVATATATVGGSQTTELNIPYFNGANGPLPDIGTPVTIYVIAQNGDNNQDIFKIGEENTTLEWPDSVGTPSNAGKRPLDDSVSPNNFTFENPVKCYVSQNATNQTYQATIWIENPFLIPLSATLAQSLPPGIIVLSTDGTLQNSVIRWTNTIATNSSVKRTFAFTLSTTPGAQTNLPAPSVTFNDLTGINPLSLQAFIPTFSGLFPVQVSGFIPTGVAGVNTPMKLTVTNLTTIRQSGVLTVSLTNSGGIGITNVSQLFSVNGSTGRVLTFALPGNLLPGAYSLACFLNMPVGQESVLAGIYNVTQSPVRPTLAVTSPRLDQQWGNAVFTVTGVASGNRNIQAVWYQINSNGWAVAAGTTRWTASVTLNPGTNNVLAYAVDANGNMSLTNSVKFLYITTSMMTILTNGNGKITPNLNRKSLNVGEGYTLTAVAGSEQIFSNWSGSINASANPLAFLMQSNMVLQANFIPSPFVGPHGIYNGLFYTARGVSEETAGMLRGLNLGPLGTYSATLLIAGKSYGISGGFDLLGHASNSIPRTVTLGGPLGVQMTLNWSDSPPEITGTVSGTNGGSWVANLLADRSTNNGSAEYTTVLSPQTSGLDLPPGYGYMTITNHAGVFTITGALADGTSLTAVSQTVPVAETGDIPIYNSLYGNTGLLLGWVNIAGGAPVGNLEWIKKASRATAFYTNGFTNLLSAQGSLWTNPAAHTAAIDLPEGQLNISGGALLLPLSFNVAMSNNNTLVKLPGSPTNSLTGTNNPKTGLLTITFGNGSGKATTVGAGVVLQNSTNAGGFFLGKTNAGSMLLQP